jgi:anaerobic selenocysteine-containing dehydrogenase
VTRRSKASRELIAEFFIEVGASLATDKGISTGDLVTVMSARFPAGITGRALVTGRLGSLRIVKDTLHMVAVPENFSSMGEPRGAPAHNLTLMSGDPNTATAACRMFLCDIAKA